MSNTQDKLNQEKTELQIRIERLRKGAERKPPSDWMESIWKRQNEKYIEQGEETVDEKSYWKWYRAKHLKDKYFKLEHVYDIGLPFDVAIVLAKRGAGKTVAYMNLIKELWREGKQFVIVRNTQQEIKGGVREKFEEPDCPFRILRDKYIVLKEDKECVVGYVAYLSGVAQQWQGASYDKVHTIIWDEATNAGKGINATPSWIRAFWHLTSTFFRNRLDWKVWIFGNLLRDSDGKISDALLQDIGIDSDCNFKYITKTSRNALIFRTLYLNTASLYTGADDHLMANIGINEQNREELASNSPYKVSDCIIASHFFVKAQKKEWGIFTTFDGKRWMILIASEPNINFSPLLDIEKVDLNSITDRFYIIRCEELLPSKIGSKDFFIYTDDSVLATAYKDYCYYKLDFQKYWYRLWKLLKSGRTLFVGDDTFDNLQRIMNGRKDIIKSYREEKFPKKKAKPKSKSSKK